MNFRQATKLGQRKKAQKLMCQTALSGAGCVGARYIQLQVDSAGFALRHVFAPLLHAYRLAAAGRPGLECLNSYADTPLSGG
jgi:hypothetical protein